MKSTTTISLFTARFSYFSVSHPLIRDLFVFIRAGARRESHFRLRPDRDNTSRSLGCDSTEILSFNMWSAVNDAAKELLACCSSNIKETRKMEQEAINEIKSNSGVLSALAFEDEDPGIKKREFEADAVDKYQNIVASANYVIGQCVSGLEDMETRMRKERVESALLGGRRFADSTFLSAKSACVKMNNVYACGFLDKKGKVFFVDKSYPLVADSVYLTGIQLGVRDGGRTLVVDHLNYAVFGEHGEPPKVYRDECTIGNEVTDLPEGRLSESCMNDTKEFSDAFEVDVCAGGDNGSTLLSIAINMSPRLYESFRGFEYTGPEPMEVDNPSASADGDEDTSNSSTKYRDALSYYKPSEDPATRSADRMLSEEFLYTRDLHKVLVSIRNKGEWDKPLSISVSKPSLTEEPLKVNPVLEGLSQAIGDDRRQAVAAFPYDVQKAIAKVVCGGTAPNKLTVTNTLEETINSNFKHERDINIAKILLEDEDYGTKYALAITKEIMSSTRFLGGMGLDHSSKCQKDTIEGMRSDCGGGDRHTTLECLRHEELAEAVRDLLCTEFGAKMTAADAKALKSKPFCTFQRQNQTSVTDKKRRAAPEKREGVKKRKLEAGGVVTSPLEEEGPGLQTVSMGTVIPPPLSGEPKEITSSRAMTEMIAEYASIIARYIAKSPLSSIRMASVIDTVFTLKKTLSGKVSRRSANTVSVRPVEFDDEESICTKMYTELMSRDVKNMEHVMNKHKAEESVENGMRALLTMRRLCEERNAYRHLVEVLILENVIGILSGEGVTYSNALYTAAAWYIKVVVRNRICGNRNRLDNVGAYTTEVCLQVGAALDWLFRFHIDHKLILGRDVVSDRAFAQLAPPGDDVMPIFKPGGRFYALIGGEDTLPMKTVKMPSSTSILKTVGVLNTKKGVEDHLLCINNYETSNMFMLSMADINMVERVDKLKGDDRNQLDAHQRWKQESPYLYATPSFQLARDTRKISVFHEIVSGEYWDEFAAAPHGGETRRHQKPSKCANVMTSYMVMPFLFRGRYKESWKNLPLFGETEGGVFRFEYEANPKGRLMISMVDQALAPSQETKALGNTLTRIVNIIEFYTKNGAMEMRGTHTLSRTYLTVYWRPAGVSTKEEEVCRFDCTHSGVSDIGGADLYAAVDAYTITGPKNIGRWKRFVSYGSTGKVTAKKVAEVSMPLLEEGGDAGEERRAKKVGGSSDKYAIPKLPKPCALMTNDVSHANVAPFMTKMYNIVRQGQNIREKYTNKIFSMGLKSVSNKKQ